MSSGRHLLRALCDPYPDLLDKAESYLALVELWAWRGNAATLSGAVGAGKHAVVAGLAARSLPTPTHPQRHFQAASGLSPRAFEAALDVIAPAVADTRSDASTPSSSSGRRTVKPRNLDSPQPLSATTGQAPRQSPAAAHSAKSPSSTPTKTLMQKAMEVQSGAAFGLGTPTGSRPTTPRKHDALSARIKSSPPQGSPTTPTRAARLTPGKSSPGSQARTPSATPRSVRFESEAATPSSSASTSASQRQTHPYTPSKRSRLGPGATEHTYRRRASGGSGNDSDLEDQDEETALLTPTSRRSTVETQQGRPSAESPSSYVEPPMRSWLLPRPLHVLDGLLDDAVRVSALATSVLRALDDDDDDDDDERDAHGKRKRSSSGMRQDSASSTATSALAVKLPWNRDDKRPSLALHCDGDLGVLGTEWWVTSKSRAEAMQKALDQWKAQRMDWLGDGETKGQDNVTHNVTLTNEARS
ncbi:unnamed protein product [Parajaminaea phylloscopi]